MLKKGFLTFIFTAFNLIVYSQSVNNLNQLDGFKDFKFKTSIDEYYNFSPIKEAEKGSISTYSVKNYMVKLPTEVTDVELTFINNSLVRVILNCEANSEKGFLLMRFLKGTFGEPTEILKDKFNPEENPLYHIWETNQVKLVARHLPGPLSYGVYGGDLSISIFIANFSELYQEALKEYHKSSINDFTNPKYD